MMKSHVQSLLEDFIKRNEEYVEVAEKLWRENSDEDTRYKYSYMCGVYQGMLGGAIYVMQKALEELETKETTDE